MIASTSGRERHQDAVYAERSTQDIRVSRPKGHEITLVEHYPVSDTGLRRA